MDFFYQAPVSPLKTKLQIQSKLLWLGSCFAENMGNKCQSYEIASLVNPGGIVFNPLLIFKQIQQALGSGQPIEKSFVQQDDLWLSYDYHSSVYGDSKESLIHHIKTVQQKLYDAISNSDFLFITWGNAWVFELNENNQAVANCHKQASHLFHKRLVQPEEISALAAQTLEQIKQINPNLNMVITISPVKYLRWGAHENNLGKSALQMALYQLQKHIPDIHYFPAFEIMQDELRDYRFYEQDFAHPNALAIEYIWRKFKQFAFNQESLQYLQRYDAIQLRAQHQTLHPHTKQHQDFTLKLAHDIAQFKQLYPQVTFDNIYKKQ